VLQSDGFSSGDNWSYENLPSCLPNSTQHLTWNNVKSWAAQTTQQMYLRLECRKVSLLGHVVQKIFGEL